MANVAMAMGVDGSGVAPAGTMDKASRRRRRQVLGSDDGSGDGDGDGDLDPEEEDPPELVEMESLRYDDASKPALSDSLVGGILAMDKKESVCLLLRGS